MAGYFGVGVFHNKTAENIGTLFRSAKQLGAAFVFTINCRYKRQSSDTYNTPGLIPLYHYADFEDFQAHRPMDCQLVGVEMDERAQSIPGFVHPKRAIYLLGAEDHGLPPEIAKRCQSLVMLNGGSFNVAVAGSLVMYDRASQRAAQRGEGE